MSTIKICLITIDTLSRGQLSIRRRLLILCLRLTRANTRQGQLCILILLLRNSGRLVRVEDLNNPLRQILRIRLRNDIRRDRIISLLLLRLQEISCLTTRGITIQDSRISSRFNITLDLRHGNRQSILMFNIRI